MKTNLLILSLFITHFSFSQDPDIEWENTIGGSKSDQISYIENTSDGGYILGGTTYSDSSGDNQKMG